MLDSGVKEYAVMDAGLGCWSDMHAGLVWWPEVHAGMGCYPAAEKIAACQKGCANQRSIDLVIVIGGHEVNELGIAA